MSSDTKDLEAALQKLLIAPSSTSVPVPERRSSRIAKKPPLSYTQEEEEEEEMVKKKGRVPKAKKVAAPAAKETKHLPKAAPKAISELTKADILKQLKKEGAPPAILFRQPKYADCKEMYVQDMSSEEEKKAYYLSGPAGAGKSRIYKLLFAKMKHSYYNVDTYYEYLLRINHLLVKHVENNTYQEINKEIRDFLQTFDFKDFLQTLDFKDISEEEFLNQTANKLTNRNIKSIKSSLMAKAQMCIKKDMEEILVNGPTLVIDKPAEKIKMIKDKLIEPLKEHGYTQYMIFVYTPLFTALENNCNRSTDEACGRGVYDFIIVNTWIGSMKNIGELIEEFGEDKIFFIDNSRKDSDPMTFEETKLREGLRKYNLKEEEIETYIPKILETKDIIKKIKFVTIEKVREALRI